MRGSSGHGLLVVGDIFMECNQCGTCCKKNWLIRLENDELYLFFNIVFGRYVYTNSCEHLQNNKCDIHYKKPKKCQEYFCKNIVNTTSNEMTKPCNSKQTFLEIGMWRGSLRPMRQVTPYD